MLNFLFRFRQLAIFGHDDLTAADGSDFSAFISNHDGARIAGHAVFERGRHERRFGDEQRHGLALHV